MSHSNLTIDFNDSSFDESTADNQPVPGGINVDVSFPISDDSTFLSQNPSEDFRTSTATPASSIALMPDQATAGVMEEFLFEFDDKIDHDENPDTPEKQGLKVTTKGYDGSKDVITDINILGTFNNLTDGGTLDVHVNTGVIVDNLPVFEKFTLGISNDPAAKTGSDMAVLVSGDMNGANMGDGNDMAMINVDATADMSGTYQGGAGFDALTLVGGVVEGNGARVDFGKGLVGDDNSALITNYGGEGSGLNFFISEFETLELTNNADTIIIGSGTGHGLTTQYDTTYISLPSGSNSLSMLEIKSGYTETGSKDVMYINADSNIYLSFDFVHTNQGIKAEFAANGDVTVEDLGGTGQDIDVLVDKSGGTGLAVDYLEGTENKDVVENKGTIGVTVNLGGSKGDADVFTGSANSYHDVLDAREAYDLTFSDAGSGYIEVKGGSEVRSSAVKANVKDVDYIMVRDKAFTDSFSHEDQGGVDELWAKIGNTDVDFLKDMTHLNGTKLMGSLGDGAKDSFGLGYDVMTSAQVDEFGTADDLRVYYEGDHDDFVDTDDNVIVNRETGTVTMSDGSSTRGSTWESEIEASGDYGKGQAPGFYIEVSEKKLAVTFDDTKGEWKVDTTAIQVAEDAGGAISAGTNSYLDGVELANKLSSQFGIQLKDTDHSGTAISNDIYLNATEEAITELLAGGVQSKSYDFDFYTKVDLKAEGGDVTVNVKLAESSGNFTLDFADLDVAVESFHNVVEDAGAAISSSSEAGEFVKIDNKDDIALGNGGDDTYVIGDDGSGIYGGVALEYGNMGTSGGLTGSIDAVNFNSVDEVSDLTFRRGQYRNEEEGSTLFIGDGKGEETILFDNYNEYLDFRRVEYLTVEDGANNNEVYEIVTDDNLGGWDNEIYVADGGTMAVKLGGHDYIVGSSKADTFTFSLGDVVGSADAKGTIDLLQLDSADKITFTDPNNILGETDEGTLNSLLQAGVASGGGQVTFDFDYSEDKLKVTYDSSNNDLDETFEFII